MPGEFSQLRILALFNAPNNLVLKTVFIIIISLFNNLASAKLPVGYMDGYSFDPNYERDQVVYELGYVSKPSKEELDLNRVIFAGSLSKEFKTRYDQKFGYTDAERNINNPNRFAEQEYTPGVWVTTEMDQVEKQNFANFMVRRLGEYHVDQYMKTNPNARPVYEFKEKISNVHLTVRKGYQFHFRYSISGNYIDFKLDNPYDIESKLTLEMDPNSIGPSAIIRERLYLAYPINKRDSIAADYQFEAGGISLIGRRQLSPVLSTSITGSSNLVKAAGTFEERLIVGLTWTN